jgi:hypothetical protein
MGEPGLEMVEVVDGPVGEHLSQERPQPLGRLEFGRVGGQELEVDALWHVELIAPQSEVDPPA